MTSGTGYLSAVSEMAVHCQEGVTRYIELCVGDITCLPMEQHCDVIMISAFPGDYSKVRGTVIHALWERFGLSVEKLSRDKERDYRSNLNCWWSKPINHDTPLPYRRLLSYELSMQQLMRLNRAASFVGNIFRCLVAIFNAKEGSIITPLLSTGCQGFSRSEMLRALVETGAMWQRTGLPMTRMKVVLFTRAAPNKLDTETKNLISVFEEIKKTWAKKTTASLDPEIVLDMYISSSKSGRAFAKSLLDLFKKLKRDIRVVWEGRDKLYSEDSAWQGKIYDEMIRCKCVLTLLTPDYIEDKACQEEYNIALCCNRKTRRNLLRPFLLEKVPDMPVHMTLTQWIDCRPFDMEKAKEPCTQLIRRPAGVRKLFNEPSIVTTSTAPLLYDLFVSYCHKDDRLCNDFLHVIKSHKDTRNFNVFFDKTALQGGTTWQRTMYKAVDNSKCLVALLSKSYLTSPSCLEELAIGQARLLRGDMKVVFVCIDSSPLPDWIRDERFSTATLQAPTAEQFRDVIASIGNIYHQNDAQHQRQMWTVGSLAKIQQDPQRIIANHVEVEFCDYCEHELKTWDGSEKCEWRGGSGRKVAYSLMSSNKDLLSFVTCLHATLNALCDTKLEHNLDNIDDEIEIIQNLNDADLVVVLTSRDYLKSSSHVEELHIALARLSKQGHSVHLIASTANITADTYLGLLQYRFPAIDDAVWKKMLTTVSVDLYMKLPDQVEGSLEPDLRLAVFVNALHILRHLKTDNQTIERRPVLVNATQLLSEELRRRDAGSETYETVEHGRVLPALSTGGKTGQTELQDRVQNDEVADGGDENQNVDEKPLSNDEKNSFDDTDVRSENYLYNSQQVEPNFTSKSGAAKRNSGMCTLL